MSGGGIGLKVNDGDFWLSGNFMMLNSSCLAALGGAIAPKRSMGKGGIWVLKLMTEISGFLVIP